MPKKRVLILSTYSTKALDSGGVVRLRAIRGALEAGGHSTHVLAIVPPGQVASQSAAETVLVLDPAAFSQEDAQATGFHDVLVGLRLARDSATIDQAKSAFKRFEPDAILMEQPFLLRLAELFAAIRPIPLVYSAANLEAGLKRELQRLVPNFYSHQHDLIAEVDVLERAATRKASLVSIITPGMVPQLREWGAQKISVYGNGTHVRPLEPSAYRPLQSFEDQQMVCFGCFGSSYWPNVDGFAQVLAPSLAMLSPGSRVIMTGTFGRAVRSHPDYERGRALNDTRLVVFDHLSTEHYAALVAACDALLLPIFVGGGSPLKTADALASGRPVLMSREMASGYEDVIEACPDGVHVVNTPQEFRTAWRHWSSLSKGDFVNLAGDGQRRAEMLQWTTRLRGLSDEVAGLSRS